MATKIGSKLRLPFVYPQTELLAPTAIELVSPVDGYITNLDGIVQTAITTGGAITLLVGTQAVAGASLTFPDAATKGSKGVVVPPTANSPTTRVLAGDRIQVLAGSAFATAGAVNGYVEISTHATRDAALPA